jgi:23S rRNA (uracil1939-C5)-methyltransferase
VQVFLQPKGPDSVRPFHPATPHLLEYALPEHGVRLRFSPTEFTQVNPGVNEMLVRRAIALLSPSPGERIADFFCGLGNFSLPIAARGATVHGVEGSDALVARARENAAFNGLGSRARFSMADLFAADAGSIAALGPFDQWLVDPPRDGAIALVKALPDAPSPDASPLAAGADATAADSTSATASATVCAPRRIVYVSCNPATLARDAAVLVHEKGYRLTAAGIANMFPHTGHVESIACFERIPG